MTERDEAHCRLIVLTDEIAGLAQLELSPDTVELIDWRLEESRSCLAQLRRP
jgi:hypothetical protein